MFQSLLCAISRKKKAVVLIMVVGVLMIVALLVIALLMLSASQDFLSHSQKKSLKATYIAESQVNWAALKLKQDPFYSGGDSPPAIYSVSDPEIEVIKIVVEPGEGNLEITEDETEWYRVKAYVRFRGVFGKIKPAVRVDATVIRYVEEDPENPGRYNVYTEIKDWEEIRPPRDPELYP